jgi:predicted enzyme related to lactoylglutathione lyase
MPGKIVHFELPSGDADRAAGFWNGLFGWGFGPSAMEEFDYRMTETSEGVNGAVFPDPARAGTGPLVYFDTEDIDGDVAKIRELGGQAADKSPVGGHGWFSVCQDTEGNRFGLWQVDTGAPAGE